MSAVLNLPHGLHRGVPEPVYHERVFGLVSKSALDLVATPNTPAHLRAWWEGSSKPATPAMKMGTALHCAALTPAIFSAEYTVQPDFGDCRYKAAKDAKAAWLAENGAKLSLDADDARDIAGMVAALRAHPLIGHLLDEGDPELTLRWSDLETGLECKGRVDLYVPRKRLAIDIKTAQSASEEAFLRSVSGYRYDVQDAMYSGGLAACGAPIDHFLFGVVEKTAPYAVNVIDLESEWRADGERKCARDLARVKQCIDTGEWPAFAPTIKTLSQPAWNKS